MFSEGGVVAVTVLRHPRSKDMSWLTSDHDFVPYPSDRKDSYGMMVVTPPLILMTLSKTKRTFLIQLSTLETLGGPFFFKSLGGPHCPMQPTLGVG